MEFVQIKEHLEENPQFTHDHLCQPILQQCVDFYKMIGFVPPWICYFAKLNDTLVGSAGFKGKPINGTVEISYGTFEKFRGQGIGTLICKQMVEMSLKSDPSIKITARTLPENNYSTKILRKNNFELAGTVNDPEDGVVWEWVYRGKR